MPAVSSLWRKAEALLAICITPRSTSGFAWHRKNPNYFIEIPDLPANGQTIEEIAETPWDIDTLLKFEKEREAEGIAARSLKQLILDMEDEVLANAGVDVFEEVFKLIFTKLYDELSVYQGRYKDLRFRNTNTAAEVRDRVNELFTDARKKRCWKHFAPRQFPNRSKDSSWC